VFFSSTSVLVSNFVSLYVVQSFIFIVFWVRYTQVFFTDFTYPVKFLLISWIQIFSSRVFGAYTSVGQWSGSEFGSGSTRSTCFWASRILLSSSKIERKNLDFFCFVTSFGLFIFENDVNVPSKSNKQKNVIKNYFFVDLLKVNDKNSRILIH
jgi:hypothetical protein